MKFISKDDVSKIINGKSVAIVGSGPGVLDNREGFIDAHDLVIRVNNYKTEGLENRTGKRTDIHYSFYGGSIKKTSEELKKDGVFLSMCKCPNVKIMESKWHKERGMENGVDFRSIYRRRASFWFCDTYVPDLKTFMQYFQILNNHVPTTGFQCILEILSMSPSSVYLTGFDFFESKIHNVNTPWKQKNLDDPIRHLPEKEKEYIKSLSDKRLSFDSRLNRLLYGNE
jgi:hypothetical protein